MKYIYSALFKVEQDKVYARVPDLPGCITTGKDLEDAIDQITDAASIWLVSAEDDGEEIPAATPQSSLESDVDVQYSLIQIDTIAYRSKIDTRAVRKNVSLPAWMATMADQRGINCSQVLQNALKEQLQGGM